MEFSHKAFVKDYRLKKKKEKRWLTLAIIVLVFCFLLSLCFRTVIPGFIPKEAFINLWTEIKLLWSQIFGTEYYLDAWNIMKSHEFFSETITRFVNSFFTVFSGMALGLAGAVYQQIYKNPIASPSTIGATAGVTLGNMVVVTTVGSAVVTMATYRYAVCLGITLAITLIVVFVGKWMGFRTGAFSVVEMLILGSIISRMITAYTTYRMYQLSGDALIAYQQVNLGINQSFTTTSMILFIAIILLTMIPILKMRYRYNSLGFDQMEAKSLGVNLFSEQITAQILAALMVGAACIQCGDVGLFALVIPHFVRYIVGADFRKLAVYSTVFGGIFLLIMRMISALIFLGTDPMPINTIVSIIMVPIFCVLIALKRRGFD